MELADESVREVFGLKQSGKRIVQFKNVELSTLGRRIRRARKLLGFSQKDFSMKCGLDGSYLGGVERGGGRNVTFAVLCTICDGLTCDIAAVTKGIPHLKSSDENVARKEGG
jgi:transcriptional regulator with XRE-family HTH domain